MAKLGLKLDSKNYFNHRPTVYSLPSIATTAGCWSSKSEQGLQGWKPFGGVSPSVRLCVDYDSGQVPLSIPIPEDSTPERVQSVWGQRLRP